MLGRARRYHALHLGYGGGGSVSESQAFAPWFASESVAGAARDTSALEAFEDTSEL